MTFLRVKLQKIVRYVTFGVIFFSLAGISVDIIKYVFGHGWLWGFNALFQLDLEMTFPAYFQTAVLLINAGFMGLLSNRLRILKKPDVTRWKILAWIFVYIATDEILALHDRTIEPLRNALHTGGVLYFSWVIYGSIVVAIIAAAYWPFLWRLPKNARRGIILAGLLYVGGALFMEMAGGVYSQRYGQETLVYNLCFVDVEETLEMLGMLVFLRSLVLYWRELGGSDIIQLTDPAS